MYIEKVTRKSKQYNEDRFLVCKSCVMVMDGATSLKPTNIKPSGGSFLTMYIKKHLPSKKGSVIDRLNEISKEISNIIEKNDEAYLPSAGLVWCEIVNENITIHSIGDCEAIVVLKSNEIIRLVQSDLMKLDSNAIQEMCDVAKEKNISIKEARKEINDTLVKNRKLMNREGGYSVFAPYANPNFKFLSKQFSKEDVASIYLFTDGFAQAFDLLNIYDGYKDMFSHDVNLKDVINKIVSVSKSDPDYNKYPRFKLIDDITAVKIKF